MNSKYAIKWTEEEKEYLSANYIALGAKQCAEYLGRPVGTVHNMASYLGLSRRYGRIGTVDRDELEEIQDRVRRGVCMQCSMWGGYPYCSTDCYNDLGYITGKVKV